MLSWLPSVLRGFVADHPEVDLEFSIALSSTLIARYDAGELDIVLCKRWPGETRGEVVWRDEIVWVGAGPYERKANAALPLILYPPPSITRSMALRRAEPGRGAVGASPARARRCPASSRPHGRGSVSPSSRKTSCPTASPRCRPKPACSRSASSTSSSCATPAPRAHRSPNSPPRSSPRVPGMARDRRNAEAYPSQRCLRDSRVAFTPLWPVAAARSSRCRRC